MKIWISILCLFMGLNAVANPSDPDPTDPTEKPNPPAYGLEGNWEIHGRYCYSGAPVRDAFVFGRDTKELTIRKNTFRTFADVQGCIGYSSGDIDVQGNRMTLYINKQVSTCTRDRFQGVVSYPFQLTPNHLTIGIGPIGFGGPCPQGDTLSIVYSRY